MTVPSPCISVCYLDRNSGHCVGCYRTMAEIGEWMRASDDRRREIVRDCAARREQAVSRASAATRPSA
ncbi:MAG: DUF1289 domain-containing protein [Minwuia sp.]|uniref:DUF1289 domain-containing protein n=1 Tax=Minwuia sp. TaxID=2493630 RepID=UPI003A8BD92C